MSNQDLDAVLSRLAELTPNVQHRWEAEDRPLGVGRVLSFCLEPSGDATWPWRCGYRVYTGRYAYVALGMTPSEVAAKLLGMMREDVVPGVVQKADDIHAEIARLVALSEQLVEQDAKTNDYNEDAWEELEEAVHDLDEWAGPGLAIGRFLFFQVADGSATYLIDRIEGLRVHCAWLANHDEREAPAVDADGWCLRSVAEAQCRKHDEQRAEGRL
jgi:hypothetical protein